jgi:hypothetical protein
VSSGATWTISKPSSTILQTSATSSSASLEGRGCRRPIDDAEISPFRGDITFYKRRRRCSFAERVPVPGRARTRVEECSAEMSAIQQAPVRGNSSEYWVVLADATSPAFLAPAPLPRNSCPCSVGAGARRYSLRRTPCTGSCGAGATSRPTRRNPCPCSVRAGARIRPTRRSPCTCSCVAGARRRPTRRNPCTRYGASSAGTASSSCFRPPCSPSLTL